jgi:hypothetical protein
MDEKGLRQSLHRLRTELEDARGVAPDLRHDLERAIADVEGALATREERLSDRVSALTLRAELRHPALAEALSGLADTLSRMGI